jgi:hypothetical protein
MFQLTTQLCVNANGLRLKAKLQTKGFVVAPSGAKLTDENVVSIFDKLFFEMEIFAPKGATTNIVVG